MYLRDDIVGFLALWFQDNTEHKLDQISDILETKVAETKLVLYSLLYKMRKR